MILMNLKKKNRNTNCTDSIFYFLEESLRNKDKTLNELYINF